MLNVNWIEQGATLPEPYLYFGFDDLQELMSGKVTVGYRDADQPAKNENTLAIYGDFDPIEAAGLAEYAVFEKGDAADGSARLVYPLLNHPALPFRAGLTVHAARGTWSSLPHEFEREEILTPRPTPFYEKFAYITDPAGGWGIQTRIGHLYESPPVMQFLSMQQDNALFVNDVVVIRDRDILDIPLGSHPVTGGPGVRLAYCWIFWPALERREKFRAKEAL